MKQKIILFASGNGTNAENICHFFEHVPKVEIARVYTNNSSAGVIQRLEPLGLQVEVFDRNAFQDGTLLVVFYFKIKRRNRLVYWGESNVR